jgi:trans-2-enoyl-CoA reductase
LNTHSFAQSLNLKDATLGKNYLQENASILNMEKETKVLFKDLVILDNYENSLPFYTEAFKNKVFVGAVPNENEGSFLKDEKNDMTTQRQVKILRLFEKLTKSNFLKFLKS